MKPVDYDTVADRYEAGRGPIVDLDTWRAAVEPPLPPSPVRVVDVGAEAIARWCEQMREVDTILAALTDTEFAAGIASFTEAAARS